MDLNERILGIIGLARRAGKLAVGEAAVKDAIRRSRAQLVIISEDASENTKKSVKNSCAFYNIDYVEAGNMIETGRFAGVRAAAAVSLNDYNFAKAVSDKISQGQNDRKG